MRGELAARTAARIGQRAGVLAATTGRPRVNPFTGKGLDDLAAAWQHAYDRAVHPAGSAREQGEQEQPRLP